jgi:hypothetical protein
MVEVAGLESESSQSPLLAVAARGREYAASRIEQLADARRIGSLLRDVI